MTAEAVAEELARRAGADWEIYRKSGQSLELFVDTGTRREFFRREEGWAARWWEEGGERFASASEAKALLRSLEQSGHVRVRPRPVPRWPRSQAQTEVPDTPLEAPPDIFEDLTRQVSAESRGEALVRQISIRRGRATERIANGTGLAVTQTVGGLDGVALAIGRRGSRACEARVLFRWDDRIDVHALARRLTDRAVLPLSERSTPVARGEWLLEPSVAAAVLAGMAPLFSSAHLPRWLARSRFASKSVTIVDDASADASFDGEGTASRRVILVDAGELTGRLHDLRSAAQAQARSTGHGVRPSYRVAPAVGPRRLFFETAAGTAPLELLPLVRRGLFASALTAPVRLDLEEDRFEVEFTGIVIVSGRAQMPVAGARAHGRLSQLLRGIAAVATDRQFFPVPYLAGAPTVLVERADFD